MSTPATRIESRIESKIESTWVPRVFALLGLLTIVDGCAHARKPANAATTQADVPIDVAVATLPRGRFPAAAVGTAPVSIPREEKVAGLFADDFEGALRLTGIKDRGRVLAALSSTPDDPPEDAYCVQTAAANANERDRSGKEKVFQPGLLGYIANAHYEEKVHAEHVAGQTLAVITAWNEGGGLRQVGRGSIAMRSIGAMAGVEVFAFVDQDPTSPAVNIVVTRPPIKKRSVRGTAIIATLPDGTMGAATCRHARVAFPLARGNGGTAALLVAVETEKGVRPLRVNMSTLWLQSEADARVTARFGWDGPETDLFPDTQRERNMRRNSLEREHDF